MVWFLTRKIEQNRYPTWRSTVYVLCITHWTTASSSPLLQRVNKYLQWICTSLSINVVTCHRHSHTCTESLSISQHRKQAVRLGSALMVKLFSSQPACTFPNRQQNASDHHKSRTSHKWFVSTEPMVKHKGQVSSSVVTKRRTLLSKEGHKTPGRVHGKGTALAARLNLPVAYGT